MSAGCAQESTAGPAAAPSIAWLRRRLVDDSMVCLLTYFAFGVITWHEFRQMVLNIKATTCRDCIGQYIGLPTEAEVYSNNGTNMS